MASASFSSANFSGVHRLARDVLRGVGAVDGVFEVEAGRGGAQADVGFVLLLFGLERIDHLGGAADADHEDARGQRVEGAGVPHLDSAVAQAVEREFDLADHVGRGPFQRFVDDGDVALFEVESPQVAVGSSCHEVGFGPCGAGYSR